MTDETCTDCGGTGIVFQTERRCACQPQEVERARTARKVLEAVQKQLLAFGLRVDLIETGTDQIEWEIVRTTTPSPEGVDKELIERLRAVQFSSFINRDIEMCREAADRIEALLAEIAELKQVIDDMVVDMNASMGDRHE